MNVLRLVFFASLALLVLSAAFYLDAKNVLFVGEESKVYGGEAYMEGGGEYSESYIFLLHWNDTLAAYFVVRDCSISGISYKYSVVDVERELSYNVSGNGNLSKVFLPLFVSGGDGVYLANLTVVINGTGNCRLIYEMRAVKGSKDRISGKYRVGVLAGLVSVLAVTGYWVLSREKASRPL